MPVSKYQIQMTVVQEEFRDQLGLKGEGFLEGVSFPEVP